MKKGIIDRIENGIAVIETDGGFIEIAVSDAEVKEGDTVEFQDGKIINSKKTDETEIRNMINKLFGN